MLGAVKRWGNSAAVRIPASVLVAAGITIDQAVDVREEGGQIIIETLRPARYDIESLVDAITDENRHGLVGDDAPRGDEIW